MHHKRNRKPAMSTPFYDLASLVVVPSGYKSGKIYAQKPLTTDGQLTFTRTSTATRVNASGLIESVSSGVPRLDYLGSTCPKILLEPQRSNISPWSQDFTNASWYKRANIGITSNAIAAPDGTTTADKLAPTDNNVVDYGVFDIVTSGLNTYSVFAKKGEMNYVFIGKDNSFNTDGVFFNLNTGAISSNPSSYSATITDYGNGWYRCSVYFATNVSYFFINPSVNGTSFNFSGQSGNGIYIWGAQAEVGAYATSYIPTTSAAVTRLADACSKTGISSLIGQTEGTIFGEMYTNPSGTESMLAWVRNSSAGTYGNFIFIGANSSAQPRIQVVNSTVVQAEIVGGTSLSVGWHKFAFAYKANDFAFYVDGVQIGIDSSGSVPTGMDELYIDQYIDGGIRNASKKQVLLFKTRLTNAQLAELTTL
jgi:hypothetical protein